MLHISKTVYSFDELTDSAKESAREWYRYGALDYDWWNSVYENIAQCADILGIDLQQRSVKLMGGGTRRAPCIWFSGFGSQGDGACFEAYYSYAKGCARAIRQHAPQDTTLHSIADDLVSLQKRYFYKLTASCKQSGNYYHSGCMSVDVLMAGMHIGTDVEEDLTVILRTFAEWIYRQLEQEQECLLSDTQVDESIRCNEYDFDEVGQPCSKLSW